MIVCRACNGKEIDNCALGFSAEQAKDWHNAVHQRQAILEVADELQRMVFYDERPGPEELSRLEAKIRKTDYV